MSLESTPLGTCIPRRLPVPVFTTNSFPFESFMLYAYLMSFANTPDESKKAVVNETSLLVPYLGSYDTVALYPFENLTSVDLTETLVSGVIITDIVCSSEPIFLASVFSSSPVTRKWSSFVFLSEYGSRYRSFANIWNPLTVPLNLLMFWNGANDFGISKLFLTS